MPRLKTIRSSNNSKGLKSTDQILKPSPKKIQNLTLKMQHRHQPIRQSIHHHWSATTENHLATTGHPNGDASRSPNKTTCYKSSTLSLGEYRANDHGGSHANRVTTPLETHAVKPRSENPAKIQLRNILGQRRNGQKMGTNDEGRGSKKKEERGKRQRNEEPYKNANLVGHP